MLKTAGPGPGAAASPPPTTAGVEGEERDLDALNYAAISCAEIMNHFPTDSGKEELSDSEGGGSPPPYRNK